MNKNALLKIIIPAVILLAVVAAIYYGVLLPNKKDDHGCLVNKGYSWCDFKNKCVKQGEEGCDLTQDWILNEAKKIIGLDLNVMPGQTIKWKTKDGELAFSAKGIYYSDLLKAEKIIKGFENWDKFLNEAGFKSDSYNPAITAEKENTVKYNKEKIVCALSQVDNPNNTSSLSLFCGNTDDKLCDFNSDCGRKCQTDSDCDMIVNGCRKIIVCRAKNYKFFNDCLNPTSDVGELDTSINGCICLDNQCVPEKEKLRSKN